MRRWHADRGASGLRAHECMLWHVHGDYGTTAQVGWHKKKRAATCTAVIAISHADTGLLLLRRRIDDRGADGGWAGVIACLAALDASPLDRVEY